MEKATKFNLWFLATIQILYSYITKKLWENQEGLFTYAIKISLLISRVAVRRKKPAF
jgi:hypothetical protein